MIPLHWFLFLIQQLFDRCLYLHIHVIAECGSFVADGVGVGMGVSTRIDGRCVGRGCMACVVVFFDSSKAERGMALQFSGHIPVFQKAN